MKYNGLKFNRIVFFLACFVLPFLATALSSSEKDSERSLKNPPPPQPTINYPAPTFCWSQSANPISPILTNTVPGTLFSPSQGGLSINQQTGIINIALSNPGPYTITMYSPGNNPPTTIATLTIYPSPSITILGPTSACEGDPIVLTATGGIGGIYTWSYGGLTGTQITVNLLQSTSIIASGTNQYGCSGTKTIVITVKPKPVAAFQTTSVCKGSSATLFAQSPAPANATFLWLSPGSPPLSGQTVTISPLMGALYTLSASVNGCAGTANQFIIVTETVAPQTGFSYITPLCSNSGNPFPILTDSFKLGGKFYSDDITVKVSSVTGQVNLVGSVPGVYFISYSVAAVGCTLASTSTALMIVNQGGDLVTKDREVTIEEGQSIDLSVTGGSAYSWDPPDFLSCTDCDVTVASPTATTKYCVRDVVDGCINYACTEVIVVCVNNGDFGLPNAFTPNGDKNNDCFNIKGWSYCVTDFKIMIFDRWGAKIYESTDSNFCWDGTSNGTLLNAGVYVYTIAASINRNPISVKKGNITLIR